MGAGSEACSDVDAAVEQVDVEVDAEAGSAVEVEAGDSDLDGGSLLAGAGALRALVGGQNVNSVLGSMSSACAGVTVRVTVEGAID